MKSTYLLFTTLLLSVAGYAQKARPYSYLDTPVRIDSVTGGMIYTEVIAVEGATAAQLHSRAKTFLLKTFTSQSPVVQLDDIDEGIVGGKGSFNFNASVVQMALLGNPQYQLDMAVEIRVKDGRYRYEFSNLEMVTRGYRLQVDQEIRKNPERARRDLEKGYTEKQYRQYMGDKNPIMSVIKVLKQTMAGDGRKNDF